MLKTQQKRSRPLLDLFPPISPYSNGFLAVDDPHNLYWEQSGNPEGVPVVLLHGGPGAGASPTHRQFFDPEHFRIIIFDQRGAGRSMPHGSLIQNSPEALINDIEALRQHLNIKRWHVFGGSWGATLAMAYAARHPKACMSLILRGIFLCQKDEIDWFLYGMRTFFPEAWEQFSGFLKEEERSDILKHYYHYLTEGSDREQLEAAIHWTLYEGACSSLLPNYEVISTYEQKKNAMALAKIECHYFLNHQMNGEESLLNKLDILRKIPAQIIQGRYDTICPVKTAHKLHQLWPEADYVIVPDAGHSALDPALRSRLIEATENIKTLAI